MPKATVLVPAYNCGNYIEKALESVSNQTFRDYNILVIDDGCTDDTEEKVTKMGIKSLTYLKNEKNKGIVDTLNRGIDIIDSPYIVRMDGDDIMLPNRLKEQLNFLDSNVEYGMTGSWYHVINEDGLLKQHARLESNSEFLALMLLFTNTFAHSSITMRSHLARDLRYDKNYQYCEDHELWTRFSRVSKVTNLPQFHLAYRRHPNSTCSQKQKELKTVVLQLLSRELDILEIPHSLDELMLQGAACFGKGRLLYKDPKHKKAIDEWYDKIFSSRRLRERHDEKWLVNFRKEVTKKLLV